MDTTLSAQEAEDASDIGYYDIDEEPFDFLPSSCLGMIAASVACVVIIPFALIALGCSVLYRLVVGMTKMFTP